MEFVVVFAIVLLVAGYVAFIVRLTLIAFWGARNKSGESFRADGCRCLLIDDMEDCDYELFWQTQLPFLELIGSAGPEGVRLEEFKRFHSGFARSYPELCDGSVFSDWVAALESAEVVTCTEATISITAKGRFILENIESKREASRVR